MGIMDKAMIEKWVLPHRPIGTRGFATTVPLTEIVECIFHRLYSTLLFLLTDNQKVTLLTNLTESKLSHVKALAGF